MAGRNHMTWYAGSRRWRKCVAGKWYSISCKQLGVPETKEASWRAANAWWESQAANAPDGRVARATLISRLVRDFSALGEDARKEAVEALLGVGSYDGLKSQAETMLASMDDVKPDRTISEQVKSWKALLHSVCRSGQMSEGRYEAYCRKIRNFAEWIGPESPVDAIDEARVEAFFNHLSARVGSGEYSPATAHETLMTAKQFISRLAEMRLIPLPGNLRSGRFRFKQSAAARIETYTVEEVRAMLSACDGFSERTNLYLLLMLNCGCYQNDISELRQDEVDWKAGTITRARSKTRDRNGPVVTYKLWPETFALLKKFRADGDRVLTTENGKPLVDSWLEGEKVRRYDTVQSAWNRLCKKMGGSRLAMKHLRKTSSTILGQHPQFKFFTTYFLADSPRGMSERHYTRPNDAEFSEALDWLRGRLLGAEGG